MADYSGYFLQGLAGGIQSGINMGTQLQEMRWQKKQRKELEEKQAKMMEVSNLWNAKIKEAGADNIYSDEEIAQISTIYLSGGYEFMEHYQGAMNAIKSMNKAKYDQEKEWMDLFVSGVEGLPPGDIQAMYEYVQPYVTSEKGENILEAYNNILQKRGKIAQAQPTAEVFATAEAVQEAYPGQGYKYDTTAKGYVPTYQKPEELSAADKKYNWAIDNYKADKISFEQLSKFMGTDISDPEKRNTIQQRLDEMDKLGATTEEKKNYLLGGGGGGTTTPAPTSTENIREDILNADTFEDAQRIYKNYADKYDETALGITDLKQDWVGGQITYLNNIKTAIGNIIDEKGWLKKGTLTSAEVGLDFKGDQKVEEIYEMLRKEYMKYFDMLTKMGLPLLEFPILKPLEEIEKVGLGEGFWGWGKQKGQYKSIYK